MNRRRRNTAFHIILCLPFLPFLSGCAPLLFAGAGVAAGYTVSRDSVTMDLDRPWHKIWPACLEEIKHQGLVKVEDRVNGRIDAKIQKTDVVITLTQLSPATVRVVIRARKYLLPQVEAAEKIAVGIARRVG